MMSFSFIFYFVVDIRFETTIKRKKGKLYFKVGFKFNHEF